jgi:hypothetical protein
MSCSFPDILQPAQHVDIRSFYAPMDYDLTRPHEALPGFARVAAAAIPARPAGTEGSGQHAGTGVTEAETRHTGVSVNLGDVTVTVPRHGRSANPQDGSGPTT